MHLLATSFNPHVRYGVAMAIGIGCAGTGFTESLKILVPLAKEGNDDSFVR